MAHTSEALKALENLVSVFPTEDDLLDAEWPKYRIEAACEAYDRACAVLTAAKPQEQSVALAHLNRAFNQRRLATHTLLTEAASQAANVMMEDATILEHQTNKLERKPLEAEPVAIKRHDPGCHMVGPNDGGREWIEELKPIPIGAKLYTSPPTASAEPVGEVTREGVVGARFYESCNYGCSLPTGAKLYTQAQAVKPMSDEQQARLKRVLDDALKEPGKAFTIPVDIAASLRQFVGIAPKDKSDE